VTKVLGYVYLDRSLRHPDVTAADERDGEFVLTAVED
jgi:hypothetical protein